MRVVQVLSRNADFQRFEVLRTNRNKRHRMNAFLVEGVRNINGASAFGWTIQAFLYAWGKPLSRWANGMMNAHADAVRYELSAERMDEISAKDESSELMAIVAMRAPAPEALLDAANPLLALFDRPGNRGNLGTVIRSCDALGVGGLIVTGHGVDPYDPEVVTATMGSLFKVPVVPVHAHQELKAFFDAARARHAGFQVLGTSARADKTIYACDLTRPTLFMIGNETDGLAPNLRALCDDMATIPMAGDSYATSLNVACAAAILFGAAGAQRVPKG